LKNSKKTRTVFYNDLGSHFQAESQIKAIDFEGKKHYVIFLEDQTKRINEENILKKMANEDPLTGLLNRRSFINELNKEVERSSRIGLTCTIVMIDLDHFKNINDTYGHDFGDEVLVAFAGILKANSRQLDILCRYGGEEFLLLLPHTTLESSMHFLDRIKREFAEYHYSFQIKPTFSGGAINTEIKDGSVDVNLLLKEVDTLLYKAKNSGRNKIETKGHSFKLIKVS
jgi:diguanylate cyclase (GGDEF)-like protein